MLLSAAACTGAIGDAGSGLLLTELLHSAMPSVLGGLTYMGLLLFRLSVAVPRLTPRPAGERNWG